VFQSLWLGSWEVRSPESVARIVQAGVRCTCKVRTACGFGSKKKRDTLKGGGVVKKKKKKKIFAKAKKHFLSVILEASCSKKAAG
jgi:hypothetical protein